LPKKELKMPWGLLPVSAFAERALTVIAPRPPATGDALLQDRHLRPAAPKTRLCVLLASGAQAPTKWKFESVCAVRTPPTPAKPWQLGNGMYASVLCAKFPIPLSRYSCPLCKVRVYGPPDHRRTQQVGKQEAVYGRIQAPTNFDGSRPQWAE